MSIVSAYTELKPGEEPPLESYDNWGEGFFQSKTPEGLNVKWMEYGEPPETGAQFYLAWEPKVYVVWDDEEEEIENGEDREDADGSNPVERDEAVPAEPDLGPGEGGEELGDVPSPGATEPEAVE